MNDTIIKIENLSKRYRIGTKERGNKTFREAIIDGITSPVRNFRRLSKLTKFRSNQQDNSDSSDIFWALKDVSFEVKQGEVIGIIGRNGAGKSTLLKILSRITEPTSGEVKLYGRVSSLLEVGTGFHPELTGKENIYLNGAILGMRKSEIDSKFDEIVDFAQIEKFLDTPVKRYSSGMYVRLAFAVAAHLEPEILIVDEVLAVGDAAFQKKCLGKMGDVAKGGRTVLFVSHNMTTINTLCDSAIWLDEGTVCMNGDTQISVQAYLSSGAEHKASKHFEYDSTRPAQIIKIELLDERGKPSTTFDVLSPIRVSIQYHIGSHLHNIRIGVRVCRNDGIDVFVTNSTDWNDPPGKVYPGKYIATLSIPDRLLAPGHYFLTIYIGEPNIKTHDSHENTMSFEISGNPFRLSETRRGFLIYPFNWKTQKET